MTRKNYPRILLRNMAMIEQGQPTPRQVVEDAFASIPDHELVLAVPAQTPEEDAIEDAYTPEELSQMTREMSNRIMHMLGITNQRSILDIYRFSPGNLVRHYLIHDDNGIDHCWRVASSSSERVFEIRTGPFHDGAVDTAYEPQLKITALNGGAVPPNGRKAFKACVEILSEVMPGKPTQTKA